MVPSELKREIGRVASGRFVEEHLARVEIRRTPNGAFSAILWTETEGDKEIRARSWDALSRELTMDLEFAIGEQGAGTPSAEDEFEHLPHTQDWEQ